MKKLLLLLSSTLLLTGIISCADDVVFKETNGVSLPPSSPQQIGVADVESEQIQLYWSEPLYKGSLSGGGNAAISYYEVEYSQNPSFRSPNTERIEAPKAGERISVILTGLLPQVGYYVRIRAVNNNTDSEKNISEFSEFPSNPFETKSAERPPGIPRDLRFRNISQSSFDVSWSVPADTGLLPDGRPASINGYTIEWSTDITFLDADVVSTAVKLPFVEVSNLEPSKAYYFRISAINNNRGDNTSEVLSNIDSPIETLTAETRPAKPQNIKIVDPANDITETTINLEWDPIRSSQAGTTADGVLIAIKGYEVRISTSNLFPNTEPLETLNRSIKIQGLTPGQAYYIQVRTVNENKGVTDDDETNPARYSDWQDLNGTVITNSASESPGPPSSLSVNDVLTEKMTVSWQAPTNTGKSTSGRSSEINNYKVEYSTNANFIGATERFTGSGSILSYTIEGLAPDTDYYIRIFSLTNSDDSSANISDPANNGGVPATPIKTLPATSPPGDPIDPLVIPDRSTAVIRWGTPNSGKTSSGRDSGIKEYLVEVSENQNLSSPVFSTRTTLNSITATGLAGDTKYYASVTAINNNSIQDTSDRSYVNNNADGSFQTLDASESPETPTNLLVTAVGKNSIDLDWAAPNPGRNPDGTTATLQGYTIEVSTSNSFISGSTLLYTQIGTSATRTIDNLQSGTTYFVHVRAENDNQIGNLSQFSGSVDFTTNDDARPPQQVPEFKANEQSRNNQDAIFVTWRGISDAGTNAQGIPANLVDYKIYYSEDSTFNTQVGVQLASRDDTSAVISVANGASLALKSGVRYYLRITAVNNNNSTEGSVKEVDSGGNNFTFTQSAETAPTVVQNLSLLNIQSTETEITFELPLSSGTDAQGNQSTFNRFEIFWATDVREVDTYQKASSGSSNVFVGTPVIALRNQNNYFSSINGLSPRTRYFIAIYTFNSISMGENRSGSAVIPVTTEGAYSKPAPANSFIANNITSSTVDMVWNHNQSTGSGTDDLGNTAIMEQVIIDIDTDRNFSNIGNDLAANLAGTSTYQRTKLPYYQGGSSAQLTGHTISGLRGNTTYYARVTVSNNNADSGFRYSDFYNLFNSTFRTPSAEIAPEEPINFDFVQVGSRSIEMRWIPQSPGKAPSGQDAIMLKYHLEISTVLDFSSGIKGAATTVTTGSRISIDINDTTLINGDKVVPNTVYYVRLRAENDNPNQNLSNWVVYEINPNAPEPIRTLSDDQDPGEPTNVTMDASKININDATVTWNKPSNTGKNSQGITTDVVKYDILYSDTNSSLSTTPIPAIAVGAPSGYVLIANTGSSSSTQALNISGLSPGTRYHVWVRSRSDAKAPNGAADTKVSPWRELLYASQPYFDTSKATTPPIAPTNLSIANMNGGSTATSRIRLQWDPLPAPDLTITPGIYTYGKDISGVDGAGLKEYEVQFSTNSTFIGATSKKLLSGLGKNASTTANQSLSFSSADVSYNNIYYFRVRAVNDQNDIAANTSGPWSNVIQARIGDVPPTGKINNIDATFLGYDRIEFMIDRTQTGGIDYGFNGGSTSTVEDEYFVELDSSNSFATLDYQSLTINKASLGVFVGLRPATKYYLRVKLMNNNNQNETDNSWNVNRSLATSDIYDFTTFRVIKEIKKEIHKPLYGRNTYFMSVLITGVKGTKISRKLSASVPFVGLSLDANAVVDVLTNQIVDLGLGSPRLDTEHALGPGLDPALTRIYTYDMTSAADSSNFYSDITEISIKNNTSSRSTSVRDNRLGNYSLKVNFVTITYSNVLATSDKKENLTDFYISPTNTRTIPIP